ncbi:M4 family metallopeptidase [Rhizobium paknamense]|uniref:Neutral metalloproteinase n=1 Tax=Rhizobium paknamense TaxID=1206817 RepID=A0ABU0IA96_9HYPH|nr:M4 family metallopeptidase [Rhizobium paknamense]MDQ0454149.1 Zn-dependent metalloprotease [Rhizobium paknamense]
MCQMCRIVPEKVLIALAEDPDLPEDARNRLSETLNLDQQIRRFRDSARELTLAKQAFHAFSVTVAREPSIPVYDCNHSMTLPGVQIADPASSRDADARTTFETTSGVARFFREIFDRNSINGNGMTILSSIHYGEEYNNAFWNGTQMAYGDGDGQIFVAFCRGTDVVGHELTHGVTQYTLGLNYENQAGGLNESLSDVFGTIFKQWLRQETVTEADWLIGNEILGPAAKAKYTCLRDMADPEAAHAMGGQVSHFRQYRDGMDPHESSGIPNLAFYKAAMALGGKSWDKAGPIWYHAMTENGTQPDMTMAQFAGATLSATDALFGGEQAVRAAVDKAWRDVGVTPADAETS